MDVLVYASIWVPWPFAQRDMALRAVGCDLLKEEGCVAVAFESPAELPVSGDRQT